jgi:amino acid permease
MCYYRKDTNKKGRSKMKKSRYSVAFTIYASIIVCILIVIFVTSNGNVDIARADDNHKVKTTETKINEIDRLDTLNLLIEEK